jgi:DNA repair protein SbcD/Mre11
LKIIHFADFHLGVETYGRVDPATGLNTRLQDFLRALDQLVDYALENRVDLVLFCGDAYKSREPSQTQQREFARRIARLAVNGIPVFLLVGNHDLHNAFNKATAVDIFDTLSVQNVHVSNRPEICCIPTAGGTIQIASLPWLRRGSLLSKDETKNLTFEEINHKAQDVLTSVITSHAEKLDPTLPSILAAHVWVTGATLGSERQMTIGQEPVLLPGNVANPAFDYVALGHIHKHQVVSPARGNTPPVVYSGSLERVDFSEERDEKGFCVIEIKPGEDPQQRTTSFEFHPVKGRRFLTIKMEILPEDASPTATIIRAIEEKSDEVKDAIVRLNIELPATLEGQLALTDIRNALKDAHYQSVTTNVERESRVRAVRLMAGEITPLEALKTYFESKKTPAEEVKELLKYGQQLMSD